MRPKAITVARTDWNPAARRELRVQLGSVLPDSTNSKCELLPAPSIKHAMLDITTTQASPVSSRRTGRRGTYIVHSLMGWEPYSPAS
eukprot:scaffold150012_cov38-Prasinocladus_malaysianus.AAC.1